MTFASTWNNLLSECEALEDDATLITLLSEQRFRITDVQEHRIIVEFVGSEESRPLQREQFERSSTGFGAVELPSNSIAFLQKLIRIQR